MGCPISKNDDEQYQRHKNIEKTLHDDKQKYNNEIKLLLLGTGESGKSTIAKQMKIIHNAGFGEAELKKSRAVCVSNTIISMKILVDNTKPTDIRPENQERAKIFSKLDVTPPEMLCGVLEDIKPEFTSTQMADDMDALWKDSGIKATYERRNEFQLMDSAEYCFLNFRRFIEPNFVAQEKDMLHTREKTTGIHETEFSFKETKFRMIDVGGQRNERRKWINCFEDVTAIIYCVALNEYDMKLCEDIEVNRMTESLELFGEICNSKWFTKTAIIIFLNKYDLFQEKIKRVDLNVLFPEYKGGKEPESAKKYIEDKFVGLSRNTKKKIFAHITTATDTENVRIVFNVAREVIISQNFSNLGFGSL